MRGRPNGILFGNRHVAIKATAKECNLVDISKTGAALKAPKDFLITSGKDVYVNVYAPGSTNQITLVGAVTRYCAAGEMMFFAIKFNKHLDIDSFNKLIGGK